MHTKVAVLSLLALAVLAAPGCFGGGDKDSASAEAGGSRGFFGLGSRSKPAAQAGANLQDLSPEASMTRDLEVLRGEEQAGLRRLEELRRSGGDPDLAMREEERLKEIRSRMARYSALLNRSQLAANPYPSREYASVAPVIPAQILERDGVRVPATQGNSARRDAEYANYPNTAAYGNAAAPTYTNYAAAPAAGPIYPNLPTDYRRDGAMTGSVMPASYMPNQAPGGANVPLREGERLIYAPQPGDMGPPVNASYTPAPSGANAPGALPQERITITQPGAQPPAGSAEPDFTPGETRFGGATVGRANYPRRPPPARTKDESFDKGGNRNQQDNLFADRRQGQPTSSYPGLEQASDERVEWPTHTPTQAGRPAARPAAQSRATTPPPAVVPVSASGSNNYTEAEDGGDEIFVPDLYLSGR